MKLLFDRVVVLAGMPQMRYQGDYALARRREQGPLAKPVPPLLRDEFAWDRFPARSSTGFPRAPLRIAGSGRGAGRTGGANAAMLICVAS